MCAVFVCLLLVLLTHFGYSLPSVFCASHDSVLNIRLHMSRNGRALPLHLAVNEWGGGPGAEQTGFSLVFPVTVMAFGSHIHPVEVWLPCLEQKTWRARSFSVHLHHLSSPQPRLLPACAHPFTMAGHSSLLPGAKHAMLVWESHRLLLRSQ